MTRKDRLEIQEILRAVYERASAAEPETADYTYPRFVENVMPTPENYLVTDTIVYLFRRLSECTGINVLLYDEQTEMPRLAYYEGKGIQTIKDLPALYFPVHINDDNDIICIGLRTGSKGMLGVYMYEINAMRISTKEKMLEVFGSHPFIFGMMPPKMMSDVCDIFKTIGSFI